MWEKRQVISHCLFYYNVKSIKSQLNKQANVELLLAHAEG